MKKYLLLLIAVLGTLFATMKIEAAPEKGAYVSVLGGAGFYCPTETAVMGGKLDNSTGYIFGGALGYKFCAPWVLGYKLPGPIRLEGEFTYRHNGISGYYHPYYLFSGLTEELSSLAEEKIDVNFNLNTCTYMANCYFDVEWGCSVTTFTGFGLGYASSNSETKTLKEKVRGSSDGFCSQFIAGGSYAINEKTDVGLEYRYLLGRENANEHAVLLSIKRFL